MTTPGTRDLPADGGDLEPIVSFSVMVPAPHDAAELEATLARLLMGDDRPSEVLIAVGTDDDEARHVAADAAARRPGIVTVVDEAELLDIDVAPPAPAPSPEPSIVDVEPEPRSSFTVMVPGPHDAAELEETLARLMLGDDPPAEVLVVVGAEDASARAVAEHAATTHPRLVRVLDEDELFDERTTEPAARRAVGWLGAHVPWKPLVRIAAVAALVATVLLAIKTGTFVYLLYAGVSLTLAAIAWTTLVWMLHAWRTPASLAQSGLSRAEHPCAFSFSLIVPARHEETVLEATLSRLVTAHHPDFEIVVVIGDDDHGTRAVADRVAARHPERVKVVIDHSWPKSKPKALNTALPYCTGAITGVFDAEDDVHPALLERVDQCFLRSGADIVQAGVQLMNFRSSWLTVRNVLEYYFWFRSRLHYHAAKGFIPLGGNTVFVRTELLRAVGGWDAECLAEDCELGVRLSSLGAKTVVFYEPELVTREECPPTLSAFAKQRTRWNQGFLQTLKRGYWRRLPLRQRLLGLYTLAMPYLMAVIWITIPVAIATAVVVKAPVPITLISFLPLLPMLAMLAVEVAALGDFCRTYGERPSVRDYLRLVLGLLVYQSVLAFSAGRAVVRELRGDRSWEKTEHRGLHLTHAVGPASAPPPDRPAAPAPVPAAATTPMPARDDGNAHALRWSPDDLLLALSADGTATLPLPRSVDWGSRIAGVRSALRAHAEVVVIAALLATVAIVQGTNTLHWPNTQFDEGTYMSNAWAVHHGALAPYTYSYGHPPLGWLLIFAWSSARGLFAATSFSIDSGRELMLVVMLVSCALLFTLARRLGMTLVFAAVAVLLFTLSPVGLFYHRAVLLDNIAVMWALAAFVLVTSPHRRLWAYAASGACFALAVLSKETILVILPALLLAAVQNGDKRTRRYCWTLLGACFLLIGLSYPLYATLKGELLPGAGHVSLLGYAMVQLVSRQATGSLFDVHSQTHAIVEQWLRLDSWLLGAALVLSPIALVRRRTRAVTAAFLIQVLMVLRPGYLPNMYVLGLLPFAALIVAGVGDALWRRAGQARSRANARTLQVAVAAAGAAAALVLVPHWSQTDADAMSQRLDQSGREAKQWLVHHIGRDKRLIVGDEFWLYMVQHGFDTHPVKGGFFSRTLVVYWPLDYDPAVKKRYPGGWRDFDYIVSTQAVRSTLKLTPTTARALDHSRVIAQFGHGTQRIEIRAIDRGR
ncbi:MAG TPA: glycosyltransferase [Thermoleophilaceae bacterium]|nr:glycosyltransferase [Thermoleophilaceae bacterium]